MNALVALREIIVHRGHMGEDLGTVKSDPVECCVRKHGNVIPAQLSVSRVVWDKPFG